MSFCCPILERGKCQCHFTQAQQHSVKLDIDVHSDGWLLFLHCHVHNQLFITHGKNVLFWHFTIIAPLPNSKKSNLQYHISEKNKKGCWSSTDNTLLFLGQPINFNNGIHISKYSNSKQLEGNNRLMLLAVWLGTDKQVLNMSNSNVKISPWGGTDEPDNF